jgi:hypothetical protein
MAETPAYTLELAVKPNETLEASTTMKLSRYFSKNLALQYGVNQIIL